MARASGPQAEAHLVLTPERPDSNETVGTRGVLLTSSHREDGRCPGQLLPASLRASPWGHCHSCCSQRALLGALDASQCSEPPPPFPPHLVYCHVMTILTERRESWSPGGFSQLLEGGAEIWPRPATCRVISAFSCFQRSPRGQEPSSAVIEGPGNSGLRSPTHPRSAPHHGNSHRPLYLGPLERPAGNWGVPRRSSCPPPRGDTVGRTPRLEALASQQRSSAPVTPFALPPPADL